MTEEDQFVYKTTCTKTVEETRKALVELHNLRQTIRRLKIDGEELAKYGPSKPPSSQGIDTYSEVPIEIGEFYEMDPSGRRTGNSNHLLHAIRHNLSNRMQPNIQGDVVKDALRCQSIASQSGDRVLVSRVYLDLQSHVLAKTEITAVQLKEAIDQIRGGVLICYPMGLPEWDPVRLLLENKVNDSDSYGHDLIIEKDTVLWFAGKELMPSDALSSYLGSAENTTAIVRLMKKTQGAPSREPVVDEDTYKGMMSWAYKKQEQQKELSENQDDAYLESEWASTKSLKQHLSGLSRISI